MNGPRASISIIIPTCNRLAALRQCLGSVLRQQAVSETVEHEIIIAVDQRDTETKEWLTRKKEESLFVQHIIALSPGANAARNAGIGTAKGKILCFLDDDCLLPDDLWLVRAYAAFQRFKDAMAVGGGYLRKNNDDLYAVCRNELDNFYLEQNITQDNRTIALLGGGSAYRKETLQNCGCFDETIRYGSAETELNDRILQRGGKLYFLAELSTEHVPSKRSVSAYLYGSWLQGLGKAYSVIKNGKVKGSRNGTRCWWVAVLKRVKAEGVRRFLAAGFLIAIAFWYRSGLLCGFVLHKLRRASTYANYS
ncbi:MAG: glycosyltransferase family A protein [Candidatus Omnitrophota bacterium]